MMITIQGKRINTAMITHFDVTDEHVPARPFKNEYISGNPEMDMLMIFIHLVTGHMITIEDYMPKAGTRERHGSYLATEEEKQNLHNDVAKLEKALSE